MAEQSSHITHIIKHCRDNNLQTVEATHEGEIKWVELLKKPNPMLEKYFNGCTPGYYNNEGKQRAGEAVIGGGLGPAVYFGKLKKWRDKGDFDGMEFTEADSA